MEVIGITGTNGKTTTSYMLDKILRGNGHICALVGTVTHRIAGRNYQAVNTTPGKQVFERYIREALECGTEYFITEVSSHSLDQGRLVNLPVKYAAFTNLSRDHMDYHESMENYYITKKKLFEFKSLESVIINTDDRYGKRLAEETAAENRKVKIRTLSMRNKDADIYVDAKSTDISGSKMTVNMKECLIENIKIKAPGKYNIYNAATAIGLAGEITGIKEPCFYKTPLEEFRGVPGRFEIVAENSNGITAVCDYAHTPDALYNFLKAASDITESGQKRGRLITVFGCGGNRDKGKRAGMGIIAGTLSDLSVITSDNPRTENPLEIIKEIESGIVKTKGKYIIEPDRYMAIRKAVSEAGPGDIIAVAGKGHEDYQETINGRIHFDDREILRELL